MTDLRPDTYNFHGFVTYAKGTNAPELVVYEEGADIDPDELQSYDELGAVEAHFLITRQVGCENILNFRWGVDSAPAAAAFEFLEQTRPEEFEQFLQDCWRLAESHLNTEFPLTLPGKTFATPVD
jgi:hypothetical protein